MVDFRYHLVSLVAVFLALAVGIVVGTTTLNGSVLDDLQARVSGLTTDKRALEGELRAAEQRTVQQEQAVGLLAPGAVDGRLTGARVVLVSTPDAPPSLAQQLVPMLREAGATIGPHVRLRPALSEASSAALLTDLVARVALPGEPLPEGEPVDQAVVQLAQVLARPADDDQLPADVVARVLAAYEGEDLLEVDGEPAGGSLAVVLTGPPSKEPAERAEADAPGDRVRALSALTRALDRRGAGTVVAGPVAAAGERGLLRAVRDDASAAAGVSSVDGADTASGRLAVVLALAEQRAGRAGAYGGADGVDAPLPALGAS